MSKKSLLYIGAGALMILVAILTFVEGALVWNMNNRAMFYREAVLDFQIF